MSSYDYKKGNFEDSFESLRTYEAPTWFRDAKFGIWSHWGAQSVPMYGDWYARNMYIEGSAQNRYHNRIYGHPSVFGYKDLVQLWKAENFNPEELMELYVGAGAKYFVGQAMHHDNFYNYPSKIHRWNSANMGPKKDICGLWKAAADKHGIPFGLTEHLGATFSWSTTNKGADVEGAYAGVPYDGNNPDYADLYLNNYEHYHGSANKEKIDTWLTGNVKHHEYWLNIIKEVIDLYKPELLYSDSALPFGDKGYSAGLAAVAHLYNTSIEKHGSNQAVYTQKDRNQEIYSVGVLDIEKSQLPGIPKEPWQTDTCIGNWFYDVRQEYKKPGHIIEMLIDIASKNGCMLLNVLQQPDGTVDHEGRFILTEMAKWNKVCGEGIYGSRPFRVFGEGDSKVVISGFKEDAVAWDSSDFRFTTKGNTLYAYMMRTPTNRVSVIKSLRSSERVRSVKLLGYGEVPFERTMASLSISLPDEMPTKYANCLAIELE